jgi:hypothetical protein
MHPHLSQKQTKSLLDDRETSHKLEFNKKKNEEQDQTEMIDAAAKAFKYEDHKDLYWNPEEFSLLYGTPFWDQATPFQKLILNHLYWVAYYSQIISAEIATIYLNQVSAAGLYSLEDFRIVCDALDLETKQERAHINAFKVVGEDTEWKLFGERLFTYPMRSLYCETMIFSDSNWIKEFWRKINLHAFCSLSSQNAFLGSQYMLIRGLRTLNGKLVQQRLSKFYARSTNKESLPIPAAISYYHFMDESHHFNTSKIIGLEVTRSLPSPTPFEKWIVNRGVHSCQKDHFHFSAVVNGIFWYEPAIFKTIYKLFRSKHFRMDDQEAKEMLKRCFAEENEGILRAKETHDIAIASYKTFIEDVDHISEKNKKMDTMSKNSIQKYLKSNRKALRRLNYE